MYASLTDFPLGAATPGGGKEWDEEGKEIGGELMKGGLGWRGSGRQVRRRRCLDEDIPRLDYGKRP